MKKSNKVIIVVVSSVMAAIIAVVTGVIIYRNNKINELNSKADFYQNKIAACYKTFSDGSEDKKTNSLSEMSKIFENYKKEKDFQEINSTRNVSKEFSDKINSMKNYFVSENEKKINDVDVDSIIASNSKDNINSAITELSSISDTIKTETSIYTAQQIDEINSEISEKISKLNDKIKSIDEADKKANEEAAKKNSETSNSVSSSSKTTGSTSKSGSTSGSKSGSTSKTGGTSTSSKSNTSSKSGTSKSGSKYNADGTINPKIFFGGHRYNYWMNDEGKITSYIDLYTNNCYDEYGNYTGNDSEWQFD